MSHPNPSHDRSNEYPEDKATHYKSRALKLKVVGKHKYFKATGDGHNLGYTSSPEKHKAYSKKGGWKSHELSYKAMHKLRRAK